MGTLPTVFVFEACQLRKRPQAMRWTTVRC